jgi:hypothetical protein
VQDWVSLVTDLEESCKAIVSCNKSDLEPVVEVREVAAFCRVRGFPYFLTSAVTGGRVDMLFPAIAEPPIDPERLTRPLLNPLIPPVALVAPGVPLIESDDCC